jgi:hypothetical protein
VSQKTRKTDEFGDCRYDNLCDLPTIACEKDEMQESELQIGCDGCCQTKGYLGIHDRLQFAFLTHVMTCVLPFPNSGLIFTCIKREKVQVMIIPELGSAQQEHVLRASSIHSFALTGSDAVIQLYGAET